MANAPQDPLHIWIGNTDVASVQSWVQHHLDAAAQNVAALLAVSGSRTAENTLAPFDEAERSFHSAALGPSLLNSASPQKELRDASQAELQRVSAVATEFSLNREVYDALLGIDATQLDEQTRFYFERTLRDYRLSGVDKDEATRAKVRELREQMTRLILDFGREIAESSAQIEITDPADLDGLPADYIARHPANENGLITITTDEPDYRPVMTYARSTELRKRLFTAYMTRCYPANSNRLLQVLDLRSQLATLLGFDNWADMAAADKMIGSAANIQALIDDLHTAALPSSQKELADLLAFAREHEPSLERIPEYSAGYYMEQYKRSRFQFDSQSVRAYFPYPQVEAGALNVLAKFFHVTFTRVEDASVWHESVTVLDITDGESAGGRRLGRVYLDMHPRPGKNKWFNASTVVAAKHGLALPEARLNSNFTGGDANDPGLMQFGDVVTFFHEFGHIMHMILGGDQRWSGSGPMSVEWDFVEVPSQMLEELVTSRAVLDTFARHHETGELIPEDLFQTMLRADRFGRGISIERQLMYTSYALALHTHAPAQVDLDRMLADAYNRFNPFEQAPDNRMYATFSHLTSYASNYYTYLFSKVISLDFYQQFRASNPADDPVALRYRKTVLEPGGSVSANTLVHNFLGRAQDSSSISRWIEEGVAAD